MSWGDELASRRARRDTPRFWRVHLLRRMRRFPVLSFLFIGSILGWCATWLWSEGIYPQAFHKLTIVPFIVRGENLQFVPYEIMLTSGELWRLVTPALLHFSPLHLVFNLLIAFEFGRRSEAMLGSVRFAFLVFGIALISNLAQFVAESNPLFGGLSGVNYGLVGFVAVRRLRDPFETRWHVPLGLIVFLIISMVLFSFGIGEVLGLRVANAAHWGGFIAGLLFSLAVRSGAKVR